LKDIDEGVVPQELRSRMTVIQEQQMLV